MTSECTFHDNIEICVSGIALDPTDPIEPMHICYENGLKPLDMVIALESACRDSEFLVMLPLEPTAPHRTTSHDHAEYF